jgi:hypothetical protein
MKHLILITAFSSVLLASVFSQRIEVKPPAPSGNVTRIAVPISNSDIEGEFNKKTPLKYKCEDVIETSVDKMTGDKTLSTKAIIPLDKTKNISALIIIGHSSTVMAFTLYCKKLSCIDEGAELNVLFRDGTKVKLNHTSTYNCKGKFTVYFGDLWGNLDNLRLLSNKQIEAIRVWGSGTAEQEDLTAESSAKLMAAFQCLSSNVR